MALSVMILPPTSLCAQNHLELLERYEERFAQLDSLIFTPSELHSGCAEDVFSLPADSYSEISQEVSDSLIDRKVKAQIRAFRGKTGLQVSGQTYFRPDEAFGNDEDDAVSAYRTKIQAELRWYFFQSSLFKRKGHINELRLKGQIEQLSRYKENVGILYAHQQQVFQDRYDSLLYCALQQRVYNLALLSQTQIYLLDKEHISSDELLNILNEKAEAERLLTSIPKTYPVSMTQQGSAGLLITVDTVRYMQEIFKHNSVAEVLELEKRLLDQQRRNTSYWSDVRVAPFVRYSHYGRAGNDSQNFDVGLSFIIPLSAETARKRRVLKAEQDIVAAKQVAVMAKVTEEVQLILEDVDRNNRLMQGEMARLKEIKTYLLQRNAAYNNRKGEYSRLARMKEYNTYLKCRESLLRYQYLRDMRLAELQTFLIDVPVQNFCQVTPVIY